MESKMDATSTDMAEIEVDPYEEWPVWFARVKELNPEASGPEGWGACYGAGLSPESAVECCASDAGRETVESYWSGMHKYELKFDLANN